MTNYRLTAEQSRQQKRAADTIEQLHGADLLGLIMQDDSNIFIVLRPGAERAIAVQLYDLDWTGIWTDVLDRL